MYDQFIAFYTLATGCHRVQYNFVYLTVNRDNMYRNNQDDETS